MYPEFSDAILIPTYEVNAWVDGAYSPPYGGWGAVIYVGPFRYEIEGSAKGTTNNRMELMAPIEVLFLLGNDRKKVTITSDSSYVVRGMTEWMAGWLSSGKIKTMPNNDLWKRLLELSRKHDVTWVHVRGHKGNEENEAADKLAVSARLNLMAEDQRQARSGAPH